MLRPEISNDIAEQVKADVMGFFDRKLSADRRALGSQHEILGVVKEEWTEFVQLIGRNWTDSRGAEELRDIIVACLWGIASIKQGTMDW